MSLAARLRLQRDAFSLDVDIDVADGEVVGLLGPNGSGKSTTLRCIAGLESPREGRIEISGITVEDTTSGIDLPPEQRRVGLVFQDYLLFPHMTVLDNVAFGLRSRGVPRRDADARARAWLARLDIADLADRRPSRISGGQAQRVALARALVTDPALLLLDEPLAALDAGTRASVRSTLRSHLKEAPGAVLLVTHDPIDAMVLADRVVVLDGGRIVQSGTPAEVSARPASAYVAHLVGVNMLRGIAGAGTVTLDGGGDLSVADREISGSVFVAVRPEAVTVHTTRPEGSPRNVWPAQVRSLEVQGNLVRAEMGGSPSLSVVVTPGAVAELGLHDGSEVWLSLKATDLDVYPA